MAPCCSARPGPSFGDSSTTVPTTSHPATAGREHLSLSITSQALPPSRSLCPSSSSTGVHLSPPKIYIEDQAPGTWERDLAGREPADVTGVGGVKVCPHPVAGILKKREVWSQPQRRREKAPNRRQGGSEAAWSPRHPGHQQPLEAGEAGPPPRRANGSSRALETTTIPLRCPIRPGHGHCPHSSREHI